MIHPTFPAQTLSTYVRNLTHVLDQNKISAIYEKSKISTKEKLSRTDRKCTKLRQHILKEYHDVFKDRLDPTDRVNIDPVHLEADNSRNIKPAQATKPYDIPFHLREPARKEFKEMLRSGVLTENTEATEWCSQSFPVQKPNSDPVKCR